MDKPLVKPGTTVDVRSLGVNLESLLVETHNVRIVYLVIPAGQTIPTHEAQGEVIVHCLEGRVSMAALGKTQELKAGQLSYFSVNEPLSIQGIEQASLIMTVITAKTGQSIELIGNKE